MREYKNRYGDVFTFTKDDDHNILWEGNFEFCRFAPESDNVHSPLAIHNVATARKSN